MGRINNTAITDANVMDPVKYISNGTTTKEIESIGILIGDKNTTGDRLGSTNVVSVNDGTNVNLQSDKNVLIKAKKAKLVFDTTESAKAGNGNELQMIAKIKENVNDPTNGYYRTEVDNVYCGDHGDILMEARRVRIKPFNVPAWTSTSPAQPSKANVRTLTKTEGYIYLDTAGLEADDSGGEGYPTTAGDEAKIEINVGNNATTTNNLSTGEYRALTIKTRGIDLRCMQHGGIALQPCGYDNPGQDGRALNHKENKIKFESSRIKDIYASDVKEDENGNLYIDKNATGAYIYNNGTEAQPKMKWVKGGDGLEFGTFNNFHSSLFTRDYRFNEDGIVYAVTREIIYEDKEGKEYTLEEDGYHLITSGISSSSPASPQPTIVKADYKTLTDDTKDKRSSDADKAALVKDIVKTAYSFNGGKDRHVKVTSSGNLEIQTNKTYHWVETSGIPGELPVIPAQLSNLTSIYNSGNLDGLSTKPSGGAVYQLENKLYTWTLIDSPEIKVVSDADVTIQSKDDDVVLKAGDVVKAEAPEIRVTASTALSMSTTPKVIFLALKFTKSAKFENQNATISTGFLNNTAGSVYRASDGTVKVPTVDIYTDATCTTLITANVATDTPIYYKKNGTTPTPCELDTTYFTMIDGSPYSIKTKGGSAVVNKDAAKACTADTNPGVTFVTSDYTPTSGETTVLSGEVAEGLENCTVADMITLVNYMKTNKYGPWADGSLTVAITTKIS